jgi:hypothetical protein
MSGAAGLPKHGVPPVTWMGTAVAGRRRGHGSAILNKTQDAP